jgi:predicted PurR-regulated permease PerM
MPASPPPRVHPLIDRAASYAWRFLVIAAVIAGALWLLGRVLVVAVPVFVALLLCRVLSPVVARLRRAGWRRGFAAAAVLFGFLVVLTGVVAVTGATIVDGFGDLGPTVSEGLDDLETWLVEDSPFDVDRQDLRRWRTELGDAVSEFWQSSRGSVVAGAVVVAEVALGIVLTLVMTFFLLKDGDRFRDRVVRSVSPARRELAGRVAHRAWDALGGYLRGAALLGLVEAVIMGVTLLLVGGELVAPVMVITFLAAFVPIVGAIVAALVTVLVALVTAGTTGALIVAVVALVVQQLDNDILAPVIYGRAVRLHPVSVLLGIAAGGALFGMVGTLAAVPVLAVAANVIDELRGGTDRSGDVVAVGGSGEAQPPK